MVEKIVLKITDCRLLTLLSRNCCSLGSVFQIIVPNRTFGKFGNSDSIVSVGMFQYMLANIAQLASALKFSFGGKVFTSFTTD